MFLLGVLTGLVVALVVICSYTKLTVGRVLSWKFCSGENFGLGPFFSEKNRLVLKILFRSTFVIFLATEHLSMIEANYV